MNVSRNRPSLLAFVFFVFALQAQGQEIQKLRDSLAKSTNEKTKFNLLFKLAKKLAVDSPDVAMKEAINASLIAQKSENQKYISRAYRVIGGIYYDQGKYPQAIENYKVSLSHAESIHDSSNIASMYNNIGRAYRRMGNTNNAMEYFHKAFDYSVHDREMVGVISNNLALVLNDVGEDSLALHYYMQSLTISEEVKDTSSIILSLNNLGSQYDRLKEYKKSEACYIKALALTEKSHDIETLGLTYDNIGAMWEDRGDLQKALIYYLKEVAAEKKVGVKIYIAEALGSVSNVYLKLKNYNKALEYAKESFKMSQEIQSAEQVASASGILSSAYGKLKNFEQAYYYLQIQKTISDSLNSIEKTKAVSNLASHYELTKKESEIKNLQFEKKLQAAQLMQEGKFRVILITFLVVVIAMLVATVYLYQSRKKANDMLIVWSQAVDQKNQELHNLNRVKDKIFSSIAHDVRSPLASIQGLLSIMNYEILSPEELQRMSVELSAKVNTTSALLENLLNWSKNQIATAKANPVKADIKKLTNDCLALYHSNAAEKNIRLLNEIPDNSFVYADEEMIRIVLRNLISNAIKFTPVAGEVKIEASHREGLLCISISDSGVGIPEENASTIFSLEARTTAGTANEKGTGLGLILCKEFIEKNGGKIWADSKMGEGTTFSFTVPVNS